MLDATAGIEDVRAVITVGEPAGGALALAELERARPGPIVPRPNDDLAALLYTGGTTGRRQGQQTLPAADRRTWQ